MERKTRDLAMAYAFSQAKFHQAPSAAKVIGDAKNEAAKIQNYRNESHPRSSQWRGLNVVVEIKVVMKIEYLETAELILY